jgi:hypothetical protein
VSDPTPVVHFAGLVVTISEHLRQRCAWCGVVLVDQDLTAVMVPAGTEDRPFPTWEVGTLVGVSGGASWTVPLAFGETLPPGSCADGELR